MRILEEVIRHEALLKKLAQDRRMWEEFIDSLYPDLGCEKDIDDESNLTGYEL